MLGSFSVDSQETGIQLDWVLVSHPLRWESAPRILHMRTKTAPADLVVLYPNGKFAAVSCYLIRQADGSITISRGDGDTVRTGEWIQKDKTILAKSRIVYRTVVISGRAIPEPEVSEDFMRSNTGHMRSSRWEYRKLQRFSDLVYLDTLIRCDRSGWDGHNEREDFVPPCVPAQ